MRGEALLKFQLICFLFLTTPSFHTHATEREEINSCKESMFTAVDLTQNVANQVPNTTFSRFIQNGRWLPLAIEVTRIGGGSPEAGSNILFETAKPFFQQNAELIISLANSCQGKCELIRSLKTKCDEVGYLTKLLSQLNIRNGRQIARLVNQYGGVNGVKNFINSEIRAYERDRK